MRRSVLDRWRARSGAERRAVAEAFATLIWASALVRFRPFRRLAAVAQRRPAAHEQGDAAATVALVRWAVAAAARRARFRAVCIEQGVAAQAMLRRRGIATTLHYGVAREGEALAAHVWVTWRGEDVVGGAQAADFHEVAQLGPARGR
ncbi:Transglutaminase-like superfamily protein [Sphingomonas guangdongensis]|uniref:Transglutaminase-like superfamily protein n=1 Tax=Sphingomonas guangdongensis TaxID=1141890 RepID=A0A285Q9S5_9SPHN|nr:lasso peptide biosynthesis B2 protein [Sphingomonas guangdongensis]SOB78586.1 Transglutaminase-like superfamily protein [Sphingomonas guangdongensis]